MTRQANGAGAGADPASGRLPQLLSALFYGTCSFLIVLVNKALLTTYGFPSPIVLGIGQMAATIMILYVSKLNKIIHFPNFDKKIPVKLFPLPLLYVGNHISGLSSTSKLSLPMFTVLRKFTIPLTLLLETIILGKQYPLNIIISVFAIVLGALIAAGSDLAFSLEGYVFVFLNDIFTAANGVYTKQKMDPQELGKYGVLFYNACFMIVPTLILSVSTGDLQQIQRAFHSFCLVFILILASAMGMVSAPLIGLGLASQYDRLLNSTNGRMFYLSYIFFFPVFWALHGGLGWQGQAESLASSVAWKTLLLSVAVAILVGFICILALIGWWAWLVGVACAKVLSWACVFSCLVLGHSSVVILLTCGFLLMYSTVLCSHYNSALTTAVVGAIKNVSVAYIGMLVGGDYVFSVLNFIGLNICMAGGLRYSFLTLSSQLKPKQPVDEENIPPDLKS